jgi:hypothetical protein
MRSALRTLLAAVLGLAPLLAIAGARTARAAEDCDVVVTPASAASLTNSLLNDSSLRVFCITAGDYRSLGRLMLTASGSSGNPRILRFHPPDGVPNAVQRPERAIIEAVRLRGSWWVVQGLTIQPSGTVGNSWFLGIEGGDHNLIEGNLIDGSERMVAGGHVGVAIADYYADPATYNTVQANVVRNGNPTQSPVDYIAIAIDGGGGPGADNDFNQILDNEIYDWGDGIGFVAKETDCNHPSSPHGTVVDGNDVFITAAKRVDCTDGTPDPDGDCACAENGIDIKVDPGPDPAGWTRVTNNRLWGFRQTATQSCGGTGSNGQAIVGTACTGHVLLAGNVVMDAKIGVKPQGSSWILAGNLFHDLRRAMLFKSSDVGLEIQFNTIVDVQDAYDDVAASTDTRCNVVVDDLASTGAGEPRGANHLTEYNFLYNTPTGSFLGPTNQLFGSASESGNGEFCFWRRRWTAPERVCVPFSATTAASPHATAIAECDPELGAPFGVGPITYASINAVPEPDAGALALAVVVALSVRARRARGGSFGGAPSVYRCGPARRRRGEDRSSSASRSSRPTVRCRPRTWPARPKPAASPRSTSPSTPTSR